MSVIKIQKKDVRLFLFQPVPRLYQHGNSSFYLVRRYASANQTHDVIAVDSNNKTCEECSNADSCSNVTFEEEALSHTHLLGTEFKLDASTYVTVELANEAGCNRTLSFSSHLIGRELVTSVRKLVVRHSASGGYFNVSWSWDENVTPSTTILYWCPSEKPNKLKVSCSSHNASTLGT